MYIGRIMHTDLITVPPEATLVEASELIKTKKIDHLLVVDSKKKLAGIISDRDLKQYWASPATSLSTHELNYLLEKVTVSMIMVKAVVTVPVETTIERAAFIMQQNRISALPAMENGELAGIITSSDVMDVLLKAIGINEDSTRLSVFVNDSIGKLSEVTNTLDVSRVNIQSLFCWPEKDYPGVTQIIFRVAKKDEEASIKSLRAIGLKVKTQYEKDITQFLPE
jgi:acetoin utilization protein AcuB